MIFVHALRGCAPTPLAHYLKALAVLRLVSEQRDPEARGLWKDECFHLATTLDAVALETFFAEGYAPSPITSPWNKGSGFLTANDPALGAIERSAAARLGPLRDGVVAARALVAELGAADAAVRRIKDETKGKGLSTAAKTRLRGDPVYKRRLADAERAFKARKENQIPRFRMMWRGSQARWMSAAIVLEAEGTPVYPALLGTGGNDGRLDFTNNYYQRIAALMDLETGAPREAAREQVRAALFGTPARALVAHAPTGQFLPGTAGGANSTNAPMGDSLVNPVDFVLALEGAVLFTAHASRRLDAQASPQAAAPFSVTSAASGYASAATGDKARGEQWMPLWDRPSSLREVQQLLAEGRARLGNGPAREPLEFARAVARLGTARGVRAFERFGYIERNGQSNLAVPLGRFSVVEAPEPKVRLVDDLDAQGWLARLRRVAQDDHAPARLRASERQLSDALFAAIQHADEPARWQRVLVALGAVEDVMASGSGFRAGPIPRLKRGWIAAADDARPELRLAVAFALQGRWFDARKGAKPHFGDRVRRHALPLDEAGRRFATTGDLTSARLAKKNDVVIQGRSAIDDAVALLDRRLVEAAQRGERHLPLDAARGADAQPADLAALLSGGVDLHRTLQLARALMAMEDVRSLPLRERFVPSSSTRSLWRDLPDDAWIVLRLATLPWALSEERDVGTDPAIVRRLAVGDPRGAFDIARRRLAAARIRPAVTELAIPPALGRTWAAALAFPISRRTARALQHHIDPASTDKEGRS